MQDYDNEPMFLHIRYSASDRKAVHWYPVAMRLKWTTVVAPQWLDISPFKNAAAARNFMQEYL